MECDLGQLKISSDANPTFVIGEPMKKVHMGNNKSLANPASTNKIFPSYGIVVKQGKNSIFLKNDKTVISVENRKFSRSWMTKWTSPLNSSREI